MIANKIGDVSPISLNKEGRRVLFLVGPTGVGKTTTLAKIAAAFALQQNARVGIITEDTYRIGAVEQLRIYADILGVPLYVVYSPEELLQKIESMGDMNLILVDTAGKNTNDKDYHKNIQKMIKSPDDAEVHLVFSATTGLNNAVGILKSYSFLEDYKLIFTKLDEVEKFGMILEIKMRTDKPLSYITHGQNVASDISEADAIEITNKILGCEVRVN